MDETVEEKLNAFKTLNDEKDNADRAIEILNNTHVAAYDLTRLFKDIDSAGKRSLLEFYYQQKRIELIDKAKELMK